MELDILTGNPRRPRDMQTKRDQEARKLEHEAERGRVIEERLASEDGQIFIKLVAEQLESRIDALVASDQQANMLITMLQTLGGKVITGRSAAERLIRMKLQSTGPLGTPGLK